MDIEIIQMARRTLEKDIMASVQEAMNVFHMKTGLSPDAINLHLVTMQTVGDRRPAYSVIEVNANVPW